MVWRSVWLYVRAMKIQPDRLARAYASAQTFAQFTASMQVNRPALEANGAGCRLTDPDRARIAALPGPYDVLVLAHDWCGDVVANLPIFAKLEAETGRFRLHIVPKNPDNTDIGALYPHPDGDVHIPIYLFFDSEGNEVAHFIERTPAFDRRINRWVAEFWTAHPGLAGRGQEFSSLDPEVRTALLAHLTEERQKTRDEEKASILGWLEANLL